MKRCVFWFIMVSCFLPLSLSAAPSPADMQGTWGVSFFTRYAGNKWSAEGGTGVFNSDGTGTMKIASGDSGGNVTPLPSTGTAFTYSVSSNNNGTLTLAIIMGPVKETYYLIFSDSKDMILLDGTRNPTQQRIGIFVKLGGPYLESDIVGHSYFGIGYQLGLGSPTLYSSFSFEATGISPPASITGTGRENQNGTPGTPYTFTRQFYLSPPDELIKMQAPLPNVGYGSQNKNLMVFSQIRSTAVGTYLVLKKNDKDYSTADLAGKFILVGIGGLDSGGSEKATAAIASLICDSKGHCHLALKKQTNGSIEFETGFHDFTLDISGSFGGSVGGTFPEYGAALGNGGNALIFNPSFIDNAGSVFPEILVGVRCSDCIYPFLDFLPLIWKN